MNKLLLASFEDLLRSRIGLNSESLGRPTLVRTLARWERDTGKTIEDLLLFATNSDAGFYELVKKIVVPESWFFRDRGVFSAIVTESKRLLDRGSKKVRILSAPCANGEEPYSVAIALLSAGIAAQSIEIVGLDICSDVLEAAKEGSYGARAFREEMSELEQSFLTRTGSVLQVNPEVKQVVQFNQHNLVEPLPTSIDNFDIVLCRNVLIYLTPSVQVNLLTNLIDRLANNGILILTPAESALQRDRRALPIQGGRIDFFVRRDLHSELVGGTDGFNEKRSHRRQKVLQREKDGVIRPNSGGTRPLVIPTRGPSVAPLSSKVGGAEQAVRDGNNAGAMELLTEHLLTDPYDLHAHLMLGVISEKIGDLALAKKQYKRVLYLDPRNFEGLSHLALLEAHLGNSKQAELLNSRARRLVNERSVE